MTVLNDCGCCGGLTVETPASVSNRAGLSTIAYRVGTHAQFKASMLARLSAHDVPELGRLKTRDDDDFTIALLDAWALVGDILAFYQERIANEAYLRTATERQSVIDLARLIGYELRPGVAATTYLAFTLESGVGSPAEVKLESGLRVQSVPGPGEKPQTFETAETIVARPEWNAIKPRLSDVRYPKKGDTDVYLAGVTTNLKRGDVILIRGSAPDDWEIRHIATVTAEKDNDRTLVTWSDPLAKKSKAQVYALRLRASLFGYNAPAYGSLPVALRVGEANPDPNGNPKFLDGIYKSSESTWADKALNKDTTSLNLDAVYPQVVAGGFLVLDSPAKTLLYSVNSTTEEAVAKFNITGKTTRVEIDKNADIANFTPQTAAVYAQSELLPLGPRPLAPALEKNDVAVLGVLDKLQSGRTLLVADAFGGETVQLKKATPEGDGTGTILTFVNDLTNTYDRTTTTIFANVAFSTNGETIKDEVLGSGDGGRAYQSFTLRQSPLTYTPADNPSGGESTLTVQVNEVKWAEVPELFGHGPRERIYVTQIDDDGTTTVQFGDGHTGARLPVGQENVKATYRKGIGLGGDVRAGQLTLLMTRPLGLRSVINPLAASGAQDRQSLGDAQTNAPVTVLTLDRIVSLRDYEDFARAFSGIAKALATWTWSGHTRQVFITVAGIGGADVNDNSVLQLRLLSAMRKAGDSLVPIKVKSYRKPTFKLSAAVKVNPDYVQGSVFAKVESALRTSFSFDARSFGQPVTLSEVIAVMQEVKGVVAVDINKLFRTGDAEVRKTFLPAESPQVGEGPNALAAELLRLDDAGITLTVMP